MATFDVSVIGELNLDLILYGLPSELILEHEHLAKDLSITLGSSSAIFAHNLASLGNKVGFSSCIGGDPFGEICLKRLGESGVDLSRVRRMSGKTTGLTVILPQRKQRYILTYPGTMYEMSERDLDLNYVFSAKHLHVSSYFLQKGLRVSLLDIFRKAKQAGLTTSLDTNDDPEDRWSSEIQLLFKHTDILLPNEREACKLAQVDDVERAAEVLSQKVPVLVIKRGSQGALARVSKEKFVNFPPVVTVADHVGAGDSFDAGFLHQYIRGTKIDDCLKFANVVGSLSVTRSGGTEAFRDAHYRDSFLRSHSARAGSHGNAPAPR
ncbi:MAG TPA: carbohydrate kinase family protein [Candidatus Limnocylindrales bacterium]|nr:carbohydrate kinase family protein [Candidatus Limnocylindrales bacterium]